MVDDGTDIDWRYEKLPDSLNRTMNVVKVIDRMRLWFPRHERPKDGLLSRAQLLEIIGPENESLLEEVTLELEMLNL